MGSKSEIGVMIESSIDDFITIAKTKEFKQLNILKKALEVEYTRCEIMKDQLLKKLDKVQEKETMSQINNTVKNLYIVMQLIEDKAKVCVELMKEKRSQI